MTQAFISSFLPHKSSTSFSTTTPCKEHCCHGRTTMSASAPAASKRPQRIAIAGAGVSGLMTAIALVRQKIVPGDQIDIFEPRETIQAEQGASLNLNGGNVILYHNYGIDVLDQGVPIERVIARSISGRTLFRVDIRKAVQNIGVANILTTGDDRLLTTMVMRDILQNRLLEAVKEAGVRIHRGPGYAVDDVEIKPDGLGKTVVRLVNGQTLTGFDLVVGADGVRSRVREIVAGETKMPPAQYTGFRVLWSVGGEGEPVSIPHGDLHQWFGDGAYAIRFAVQGSKDRRQIIAVSYRDPKPRDENETYGRGGDALRTSGQNVLTRSGMPTEVCKAFDNASRFIETPVYSHPTTGRWSRNGVCVLVGDSGKCQPKSIQTTHIQ